MEFYHDSENPHTLSAANPTLSSNPDGTSSFKTTSAILVNNYDYKNINVEHKKIQDDLEFDVLIDSYIDSNDLAAEFYHNSENPQQISVIGLEDYQLSRKEASKNEKLNRKIF